jgi:hypothetical protein
METKLPEEELAIYAAIGRALVRWARLEYSLCRVFCEAVSPFAHNPAQTRSANNPASDAFWAVTAFDGKRELTNAAVGARLHPAWPYRANHLLTEWTKINKRVGEKSRKRTKLAHGRVRAMILSDGTVKTTYAPYYYKLMSGKHIIMTTPGMGDMEIAATSGPEEEFGIIQIDAIRGGFDAATTRLDCFFNALQAHNTAVSASEAEARQFFESARLIHSGQNNPPMPHS